VAGCFEHGNGPAGSIKVWDFLDYLSVLVKKIGALWA
jgi:hypothetical protein